MAVLRENQLLLCILTLRNTAGLLLDPASAGTERAGIWMPLSMRIACARGGFRTLGGRSADSASFLCRALSNIPIMADKWRVVHEVCHGIARGHPKDAPHVTRQGSPMGTPWGRPWGTAWAIHLR